LQTPKLKIKFSLNQTSAKAGADYDSNSSYYDGAYNKTIEIHPSTTTNRNSKNHSSMGGYNDILNQISGGGSPSHHK
jgi:hypothetical protein